jgi:hypothetical protein
MKMLEFIVLLMLFLILASELYLFTQFGGWQNKLAMVLLAIIFTIFLILLYLIKTKSKPKFSLKLLCKEFSKLSVRDNNKDDYPSLKQLN